MPILQSSTGATCVVVPMVQAMTDPQEAGRPTEDNLVADWLLRWRGHVSTLNPEAFLDLIARIDTAVAAAVAEERARMIGLIRKRLVYDSQRAVSWHEVQDCLEALSPTRPVPGRRAP
jgi:hypothetical protein